MKRSQSRSSSFDYDAEKHHQLKKSRSQSPKKSPERQHQLKKSRSRSPKKSLNYHSGPKVSPQVAVNLSQQKSSLKTPDLPNGSTSQSTILNPNMGRQPEILPWVPVNSSQNSSLEMERLPEVSHEMQLSSSQENSSFNGGNSRSSEIHRNIGSTPPRVDISVEKNSSFNGTNVNFDPLVTSSSLDEQVLKEQICMDSIELATPRTETSSSTFDHNKKEKMALLVCPFNCGDEQ